MSATNDYYAELGVAYTASVDEVRKSYKKLCLKYHPDKTGGDGESHQKFLRVKEAYETLSEPSKKAAYDRTMPSKVNIFTHRPHETGANNYSYSHTSSSSSTSSTSRAGGASDGYFLFYQNYFQQQNEATKRARDFRRQWEFDSKRRDEQKRQTEELLRRQREEEIKRYQEEVRRTQRRQEELRREQQRQEELRRELERIREMESRMDQKLREGKQFSGPDWGLAFDEDEFLLLPEELRKHMAGGFGFEFEDSDISFEGDSEDNPIVVDDDDEDDEDDDNDDEDDTLGYNTPAEVPETGSREEQDGSSESDDDDEDEDEDEFSSDMNKQSIDSEAEIIDDEELGEASFASESAIPRFTAHDDTEQDSDVVEIKPEQPATPPTNNSPKRQKRDGKLFSFGGGDGMPSSAKRQKVNPFSTAELKNNLGSGGLDDVDFSDLQGSLPRGAVSPRHRKLSSSYPTRNKKPKLAEYSDGTTKAETLHTPVNKRSFMANQNKAAHGGVRQLTALDLHASPTIHNYVPPEAPKTLLDPEMSPKQWSLYVAKVAEYQKLWFEYQHYVLQYQSERHRKDKEFMEEINSSTTNFNLYLECLRQDTTVQERYLALLRDHGHFMSVYKQNCSWMKATRRGDEE